MKNTCMNELVMMQATEALLRAFAPLFESDML